MWGQGRARGLLQLDREESSLHTWWDGATPRRGLQGGSPGRVFTLEGPGDHEDEPGQLGRPGSRAKLKTLPSALKGWGRASGRTVRAEDSRLLAATANWRKLVCFEVLLFWSERRFRLSG